MSGKRRHACAGLSTIELTLYIAAVGFVGLLLPSVLRIPARLAMADQQAQSQRQIGFALDQLVADLRESDATTVNWSTVPPVGGTGLTLSFTKTSYDTGATIPCQFTLTADGAGTYTLTRSINGKSSILIDHIKPASSTGYFIQQDLYASHVVVLGIGRTIPKGPWVEGVRRVAVRG